MTPPTAEEFAARPTGHVSAIQRVSPGMWKAVEAARQTSSHNWPRWCFLPISEAMHATRKVRLNEPAIIDAAEPLRRNAAFPALSAALAAWRMTKGVFVFDPEVLDIVASTKIGNLPAGVLTRLPQWCLYLPLPSWKFVGLTIRGAFIHLDADLSAKEKHEFRILLDVDTSTGQRDLIPIAVPLSLPLTEGIASIIDSGLERLQAERASPVMVATRSGLLRELTPIAERIVNLALFLCVEEPDVSGEPTNPAPVRTRTGRRTFAANAPKNWEVGARFATALRAARSASSRDSENAGRNVRPHIRRAHWHTFWRGPHDGRRERILHWLPPILVAVDQVENVPVVVHRVGES